MIQGICSKIINIHVFCFSILFFSTALYADSSETKLKEFYKALEEFSKVKALVDENGEYQLLIEKARGKNMEKTNEFLAIVSDSKKSQYQRKAALEKLFGYEMTISQLDKTKSRLFEISSAISSRMENLESDKEFYIQMVKVDDHESANKAFVSLNEHRDFFVCVLDELGNLEKD